MDFEEFLKQTILPELEKGRQNFDKPHTEAVVYHIKGIIKHSPEFSLDYDVLVIAAYAHDWGYAGLFEGKNTLSYEEVKQAKKEHMEVGSLKIKELLQNEIFEFMSNEQKERIAHLVYIHDKLDQIKDVDESILAEADTLGSLDVERVKPFFDSDSNAKYMQKTKEKRFPLFITSYGKQQFDKLYHMREEYYTKGLNNVNVS